MLIQWPNCFSCSISCYRKEICLPLMKKFLVSIWLELSTWCLDIFHVHCVRSGGGHNLSQYSCGIMGSSIFISGMIKGVIPIFSEGCLRLPCSLGVKWSGGSHPGLPSRQILRVKISWRCIFTGVKMSHPGGPWSSGCMLNHAVMNKCAQKRQPVDASPLSMRICTLIWPSFKIFP